MLQKRRQASRFVLPGLLILIASCSSGGGGDSQEPDPGIGGPPGGPPGGIAIRVAISGRSETEPNDSLSMADPHTLPTLAPDVDFVGFEVVGIVTPGTDVSDFFSFTASRSHDFTVSLCAEFLCFPQDLSETVDVSNAYLEVFDQSGVSLISTRGDLVAGNNREMFVNAGIIYYIAVHAEDALAVTQEYYLVVMETITF